MEHLKYKDFASLFWSVEIPDILNAEILAGVEQPLAATEDNVAEDVTAIESNSETNEDHLEQQDAIVFDDMKYPEGSMIRTA